MASDISGCREAVSDEAEGVTTLAFFGGGAFAVVVDVEVGSMSMLGAIVGRSECASRTNCFGILEVTKDSQREATLPAQVYLFTCFKHKIFNLSVFFAGSWCEGRAKRGWLTR